MCLVIIIIKVIRIFLYLFKIGALPLRINPTLNDINDKNHVLQNEGQYRLLLIFVMVSYSILNVIIFRIYDHSTMEYFILLYCVFKIVMLFAERVDA